VCLSWKLACAKDNWMEGHGKWLRLGWKMMGRKLGGGCEDIRGLETSILLRPFGLLFDLCGSLGYPRHLSMAREQS